ncbi:MAG: histidine phosphatase family protein [Elusimicrobiota bacterium]
MTRNVYVFRHGETDWNAERRLQGHSDVKLNAAGREQARDLAKLLRPLDLPAVLCSDLSRAAETARIVFSDAPELIQYKRELREAYLGKLQGTLRSEYERVHGKEQFSRWLSVKDEDQDFCFPGGETKLQHLARVRTCLESYLAVHDFARIGVCTHGGTIRRFVHFVRGSGAEPVSIANCAVYHLKYDGVRWAYVGKLS